MFAWRQKSGSRFALSACCLVGLLCPRLVRLPAISRRCACMTSPCTLTSALSWVCSLRSFSCNQHTAIAPWRHSLRQQDMDASNKGCQSLAPSLPSTWMLGAAEFWHCKRSALPCIPADCVCPVMWWLLLILHWFSVAGASFLRASPPELVGAPRRRLRARASVPPVRRCIRC